MGKDNCKTKLANFLDLVRPILEMQFEAWVR